MTRLVYNPVSGDHEAVEPPIPLYPAPGVDQDYVDELRSIREQGGISALAVVCSAILAVHRGVEEAA